MTKKKQSKKNILFLTLISLFSIWGIALIINFTSTGKVMVLSISSDGHYVVSTSLDNKAVLWNLKTRTHNVLDDNANIYSAYFIKNSHNYMWQHDSDNKVTINNSSNKLVRQFNPGFPTYGQVITTDLKNYFASDEDWNVYRLHTGKKSLISKDDSGFLGVGKLLNMTLESNNQNLLLSGIGAGCDDYKDCKAIQLKGKPIFKNRPLDGVVLWDVNTGKPLLDFPGNEAKTIATMSPDGEYIVSGDEQPLAYLWNAWTGKKVFSLYDIVFGRDVRIGKNVENWKWDHTGMINVPHLFYKKNSDAIFALKFIDLKGDYLRFTTYVPYAILYNINDPKPKKYFYLGSWPYPSVDDYSRDQSIDTAPKAHILVMGKRSWGGIIVYKFNIKKETLKRIWVSGL